MQNKYKFSSNELLKTQNELYLYKMRNASNTDGNMTKEQYLKREFSAYQISLEEFSAYLTGLYAQLYTYFNSKEFLTDLESTGSQMMQIEDFRKLIGATNPADAAEGTIRKKYARSVGENAVHGSDSDENALIEATFHFSGREIF